MGSAGELSWTSVDDSVREEVELSVSESVSWETALARAGALELQGLVEAAAVLVAGGAAAPLDEAAVGMCSPLEW